MPCLLIVDRERAVLRLAKTILEKAGFEVLVSLDAPSALEILGDQTVDALLTDVTPPNAWAIEFMLDARRQNRELPICCMTVAVTDLPVFPDVPMIMKPFEPQRLIEMVQDTIDLYGRVQRAKARWCASRRDLDAIVAEGRIALPQPDGLFRLEQAQRGAAADFTKYESELAKYKDEVARWKGRMRQASNISKNGSVAPKLRVVSSAGP
jgi:CheY-like chemotaxis protein